MEEYREFQKKQRSRKEQLKLNMSNELKALDQKHRLETQELKANHQRLKIELNKELAKEREKRNLDRLNNSKIRSKKGTTNKRKREVDADDSNDDVDSKKLDQKNLNEKNILITRSDPKTSVNEDEKQDDNLSSTRSSKDNDELISSSPIVISLEKINNETNDVDNN